MDFLCHSSSPEPSVCTTPYTSTLVPTPGQSSLFVSTYLTAPSHTSSLYLHISIYRLTPEALNQSIPPRLPPGLPFSPRRRALLDDPSRRPVRCLPSRHPPRELRAAPVPRSCPAGQADRPAQSRRAGLALPASNGGTDCQRLRADDKTRVR